MYIVTDKIHSNFFEVVYENESKVMTCFLTSIKLHFYRVVLTEHNYYVSIAAHNWYLDVLMV